jgi:hypothetical protein
MRTVLTCLLFCAIVQGCARFGKTIPIAVFDGDIGEPVSGATVSVTYDNMVYGLDLFPPHDDEEKTGADGVAKVKVCRTDTILDAMAFASRGATIGVSAPGYLGYGGYPRDYVPPTFQRRKVNGKDGYAVPIYKLPAPQIVIVLPDNYRGPVRITRKFPNRWVQDEPGKRVFEFTASAQGEVNIDASPLLYRINDWNFRERFQGGPAGTFRFRYASGREIPRTSASTFSMLKARAILATQPALRYPPAMRDSPKVQAMIEREKKIEKMAATRRAPTSRPAEFGVDFITSDVGLPWAEPPQKRSLFVVGGEQEMLRFYEAHRPPPFQRVAQTQPTTGPTIIKDSDQFEKVWNLR